MANWVRFTVTIQDGVVEDWQYLVVGKRKLKVRRLSSAHAYVLKSEEDIDASLAVAMVVQFVTSYVLDGEVSIE